MNQSVMKSWQDKVSCFSIATTLETKIIDTTGKTIYSSHAGGCSQCLCQNISESHCSKSHLFGAKQAMQFGGSYIFFCPIGLVHFVSPIIEKGEMLGAFIGGHFLMTGPDVYFIRHLMKHVEDERVIKDFVMNVQVFETKRVSALAKMLQMLTDDLSDGSEPIVDNSKSVDMLQVKHQHSIHKVINHIKINYMHKVTLEEAAELVFYTPQYLSKIFSEETGYTFIQYLNHIRVDRSKQLLIKEDLSHVQIAYMAGFADQSHFSRSFKKVIGMSPKAYQLSHSLY